MPETLNYFQQGLWLAIILSAPPLIAVTIVGVFVSLIQAIVQVQDQTLPYVVKMVAFAIVLVATGRWMSSELIKLTELAFTLIPGVGR